jgi:hypothetical protein
MKIIIIFILICCCYCLSLLSCGIYYFLFDKKSSSSNNQGTKDLSIINTENPVTTVPPPTTTKPPTTKPPSLTGKWTTPNNSLGAINITMDSSGKKGTLRFEGNQTDYSFILTDINQNLWMSDGFAMQLKLIDNNKLRPVTNPWNYTDEQLTYVKK